MLTTKELEQMRKDLQGIDKQLLKLLESRVKTSVKIQAAKESSNLPIIDSKQEEKILTNLTSQTTLNSIQVSKVFKNIIELSKSEYQKEKEKGRKN